MKHTGKFFLFTAYLAVSLFIGYECHPFSTFPMYNSFPNYAYVFFLKNERNETVYYGLNVANGRKKNAGYVAHVYYSFFNHHHYNVGMGREKPEHLAQAGAQMMDMIMDGENFSTKNFDTLKLYRRYYFLAHNRLKFRDDLMYEKNVRP